MNGETNILAKVNGRQRAVSESSIRRHLKLNDEEDETAFPTGDVRYVEAFLTVTRLDAGQDRENIAKTSTMLHEASPRVTSLGGGEGKERVQSQDLEITQLKTRVQTLTKREGFAQEDAPNTRGGRDGSRGGLELDKRDSEIARIHAERGLEMMIAELDRSNEIITKYLSEYEQAEAGLSHDKKVELIDELPMYQRHLAQIKKYQA
nr:hypothetical protein [Tanacetum cinerariifolium]